MPDDSSNLGPQRPAERRFVWPPKPLDRAEPVPVRRGDPGNWPAPRPAVPPRSSTSAGRGSVRAEPAAAAPSRPGWRESLLEIERVWLGLSTPPLPDRIAAAGWAPDDPSRYCSRCGSTVGPHESDGSSCPACRGRRLPWERLIRLGEYSGLLQEVVQEVKFSRWRRLGDQIGGILGEQLGTAVGEAGLKPADAVLIPVPSSLRRRIRRGIDHALVIARGASRTSGIPLLQGLTRTHRPSQLSVPAGQRRANVARSFRPRGRLELEGRRVIVLDDVTTTRATLQAASRAVEAGSGSPADGRVRQGLRLWAAVVAVTPVREGPRRVGASLRVKDEAAQ